MLPRTLASLLAASLLTAAAASSFAQTAPVAKPAAGGSKAAAPAAPGAAKPGEPRRDPAGKTGISPYAEQINKGERAFVATDLPGAVFAFQEAVKIDPEQMLAFYRLGETHLAAGKLDEAEAAWQAALPKKGNETLQGKVLFVLADLRERQGKWQAAKDAWASYLAFVQGNQKAVGYPATPPERQKQADRRMNDEKIYAAVKERIVKREKERAKEAEDNAKKDTKNL